MRLPCGHTAIQVSWQQVAWVSRTTYGGGWSDTSTPPIESGVIEIACLECDREWRFTISAILPRWATTIVAEAAAN